MYPLQRKIVWQAVNETAKPAGIAKRISPHTLKHRFATHCRKRELICAPPRFFWDSKLKHPEVYHKPMGQPFRPSVSPPS
jgi:hypothetical protein